MFPQNGCHSEGSNVDIGALTEGNIVKIFQCYKTFPPCLFLNRRMRWSQVYNVAVFYSTVCLEIDMAKIYTKAVSS